MMSPMRSYLDLRELDLPKGARAERRMPVQIGPLTLGGLPYDTLVEGDEAVVSIARVGGGFLVTVRIAARLHGPCFRCLREVALSLEAEEEEFVPQDPAKWTAEEVSPFIEELVVDVAGIAREALVLALPTKLLCREECAGLCAQCGHDLNEGACACSVDIVDPRWDKLRALTDPRP